MNQLISTASVSENQLKNNIKVFPNPVTEQLFVEGVSGVKLKVINLLGELVINETLDTTINVSELKSGIYFLQINSGNSQSVVKFIKN